MNSDLWQIDVMEWWRELPVPPWMVGLAAVLLLVMIIGLVRGKRRPSRPTADLESSPSPVSESTVDLEEVNRLLDGSPYYCRDDNGKLLPLLCIKNCRFVGGKLLVWVIGPEGMPPQIFTGGRIARLQQRLGALAPGDPGA